MADLGPSQARQLENPGNSPAGQAARPVGARSNALPELGVPAPGGDEGRSVATPQLPSILAP